MSVKPEDFEYEDHPRPRYGGSFIPGWFINNPDVPLAAKVVFGIITSHATGGLVNLTDAEIAAKAGINTTRVRAALTYLEEVMGMVKRFDEGYAWSTYRGDYLPGGYQ